MDSGWAQAWISGAAILASGGFAIWVPWRERRISRRLADSQRFGVETERFPPAGLSLTIRYRPEFWHVGISCRVTLLNPRQAQLVPMRSVVNSGQVIGGGYFREEPDGVYVEGFGPIRLLRDAEGILSGSVRVMPPLSDGNAIVKGARLRFEIITDAGDDIYRTELTVSPIDRTPSDVPYAGRSTAP